MESDPTLIDAIRAAVRDELAKGARLAPRWLSVDDAAEYSGLGAKSIRRLLASGSLTAHRPIRGRVVIDREQLDNYIRTSTAEQRVGRGRNR